MAPLLLRIVRCRNHGVEQRRPPAGEHLADGVLDLDAIGGELLEQLRFPLELRDKGLVVLAHLLDEAQRGVGDGLQLRAHAPRGVDDQTEADRHLRATDRLDRLLDLVLEDEEVLLAQVEDRVVGLIDDRDVEDDKIRLELDGIVPVEVLIIGLGPLTACPTALALGRR